MGCLGSGEMARRSAGFPDTQWQRIPPLGGRNAESRSVCTSLTWGEGKRGRGWMFYVLYGIWPSCAGRFRFDNKKVTQDK